MLLPSFVDDHEPFEAPRHPRQCADV